jgi:hypothetical protein
MQFSFKVLLPAVQAAFTIALALTDFGVVPFREASPCDWDSSAYCAPPAVPALVAHLVESNLPAVPVLALPYVWLGGPDHPKLPLMGMLIGFLGIGIWFAIGVFLDDVAAALIKHLIPTRHICDRLFSVFIIVSSCIVFVESDITSFALSSSESVIRICSLSWVLFGFAALVFQIGWSKRSSSLDSCQTRFRAHLWVIDEIRRFR